MLLKKRAEEDETRKDPDPVTDTIAFIADLTADEEVALTTAVALAHASGARLVTVHATTGAPPTSDQLTRADAVASRWALAIAHEPMVHSCCDDVTDTLLDALRRVAPTLVVSGTHGRSGFAQLLAGSVAEGVARNVKVPTLIVPLHGPGLADAKTGALGLRSIIVPAGDAEAAAAGLRAAAWLARLMGAQGVEIVLAHVDDGTAAPALDVPEGVKVSIRTVKGRLDEALAELTRELDACALVMATRGHDGVLDALGGSRTERVLRQVACPVLSVPIG